MGKPIKCTLHINNTWGYCYQPTEHKSIAEAVRYGKGFAGGFWFRVEVDGKTVRTGHCDD